MNPPAEPGRAPQALAAPPEWLDARPLPIIETARDDTFYRCYQKNGPRGPMNFNPSPTGRFNAPNREYSTLHLSTSVRGAFVETVVQRSLASGVGPLSIVENELRLYGVCRVLKTPDSAVLRLVDLTAEGLVRIGATNELCALADLERRALVRTWGLAIHQHPDQPDGIRYRARHDPSCISLAIFDRASAKIDADQSTDALADDWQLANLLDLYDASLT